MLKLFILIIGLISGFVAFFATATYLHLDFSHDPAFVRELSERIESIPVENICRSVASGNQILGEDHVIAWSDGKRYLVVGWRVQESGTPVFYWTGADLPDDVAEYRSIRR